MTISDTVIIAIRLGVRQDKFANTVSERLNFLLITKYDLFPIADR